MKKVLLTLGLGFCVIFANAQAPTGSINGFLSTTAAKDDFSTAIENSVEDANASNLATTATQTCPGPGGAAYSGIFWYTKALTAGFSSALVRNSTSGELDYTITQPAENGSGNGFQPVGVGFGQYCTGSTANFYVLDLSASSKVVSFDFDNTSTTDDYKVQVQMQTVDGKIFTIKNSQVTGTNPGNDYLHSIEFVVNRGTSSAFSQNFANVLLGAYGANHTAAVAADYSQIKAITITVINNANTGDPNYYPNALNAATFSIDNFKIGDQTTLVSTSVSAANTNIASSKIYPNPTADNARVELELKSASNVKVTLSDVMGKEVMTISEGTVSSLSQDFSVANLNKGIYTVNYFVNGASAKSELLMVK